MTASVKRTGDMDPDIQLHVTQEDDGDIIVAVHNAARVPGEEQEVQFCTSGCRHTHTIRALKVLMAAMARDAIIEKNPRALEYLEFFSYEVPLVDASKSGLEASLNALGIQKSDVQTALGNVIIDPSLPPGEVHLVSGGQKVIVTGLSTDDKPTTLQTVARLMQEHHKKGMPCEYLFCKPRAQLKLFIEACEHGHKLFNAEELDLMRAAVDAEWCNPDRKDAYKLVEIHKRMEGQKLMGMKIVVSGPQELEELCDGKWPEYVVMSGRVMAPKYAGSRIYNCITENGNLLKGCWTYSKDEPREHDKLTVDPNCDQYEIRSDNGSRVIGRPKIAENL